MSLSIQVLIGALVVFVGAGLFVGHVRAQNMPAGLSPVEVSNLLKDDKIILVDVREPYEYKSGHIQGAIPRPLSDFDLANLPKSDDKQIVFYCRSGNRSGHVLQYALSQGLTNITHMQGGISAWLRASLPIVEDK